MSYENKEKQIKLSTYSTLSITTFACSKYFPAAHFTRVKSETRPKQQHTHHDILSFIRRRARDKNTTNKSTVMYVTSMEVDGRSRVAKMLEAQLIRPSVPFRKYL